MKKLLLFAIFGIFVIQLSAQGGTTGPLTWQISNDTLYISGEGAMPDYDEDSNHSPWYVYKDIIFTLVLSNGITYIGDYAFIDFVKLVSIISNTTTAPKIGYCSFCNVSGNVIIYILCNTFETI